MAWPRPVRGESGSVIQARLVGPAAFFTSVALFALPA
jgi:hypothetical protein